MEFDFNIEEVIGNPSKNGIVYLSGRHKDSYSFQNLRNIYKLLDTVGEMSARVNIYLIFNNHIGSRLAFYNNNRR